MRKYRTFCLVHCCGGQLLVGPGARKRIDDEIQAKLEDLALRDKS